MLSRLSLLRRVLLVAVSASTVSNAQLQAQLLSVSCLALLCLHTALRPYRLRRTNLQEHACLFALCAVAALQDHRSLSHEGAPLGVSLTQSLLVFGLTLWLLLARAAGDKLNCCVRCFGRHAEAEEQEAEEGDGSSWLLRKVSKSSSLNATEGRDIELRRPLL